jgi:hypothetical protein
VIHDLIIYNLRLVRVKIVDSQWLNSQLFWQEIEALEKSANRGTYLTNDER